MVRRDFSANALIPHGHHQDWDLIEEILQEIERVTSQWVHAETEISVDGVNSLYGRYSSVIDAKIDLGDDQRDVTEVHILRTDRDSDSDSTIYVTLAKSQRDTSWVLVSGPKKKVCDDLARSLQSFILQLIKHPQAKEGTARVQGGLEVRLQHLHPIIKQGALTRLINGHGDEAVEEACKSIGARVRKMSGLDEDGASLIGKAFGKNAYIAINPGTTTSGVSEQEGYMYLGMALYRAARNPRAHRPSDPNFDIDEVIEWLSVASALHRAIDRSTVRRSA
ncbi:TIGR02391 family protein [Streptomyces sp. N2-109]|uniref:TIGR02391 family protein n=1 Tax=Streptomyces gossypii TaxID=2883101 RepID=A0ABT2JPJ8_9ACTN|nr:TIGR02391 family protein [Streptomyces gossypii]MCT2589194.1 TIGR02391 family protein [Streptomyces gossypii]